MRPERTLRIIGGRWRARKFRFPSSDIRPTPDRVRETLFNWLQPRIEGAHCLDLFAGSGALGLEALSRGAASVLFIEQQRAAAAAIEHWLHAWQASGGVVVGSGTPVVNTFIPLGSYSAVRNVMQFAHWDLQQALRLATLNPARVAGLANRGKLEAGAQADFVVLSPSGEVRATIVRGDVADA